MTNIAELLVEQGMTREHLEECRRIAATTGESLDRVILQKDYLPETQAPRRLRQHLGVEFRPSLDGTRVPSPS
jgi:hypothetical protein